MAQITSGLRGVFSHPVVYNLAQNLVGAERARRILVQEYMPDMHGLSMLDIGCGTAEILKHLPDDMNYHGFDASEEYIRQAKAAFAQRGTFHAELVGERNISEVEEQFDVVLAFGLLHHLDDGDAKHLFALAKRALKAGGHLITMDPTYCEQQSPWARWVISKDRGQNVRTPDAYAALAQAIFEEVKLTVRHDMLHMPYSHSIIQCCKS